MNRFFCFVTEQTPYEKVAQEQCLLSFRQFGVPVTLVSLANRSDWMKNCMARSNWLAQVVNTFWSDGIGLLDADLTCLKTPTLLTDFVGDVAVLDNGDRPGIGPGFRYSAGVLIFGKSVKGRECLKLWAKLCQEDGKHTWELREQVYLGEAIAQSGVAVTNIGPAYNRHIDRYKAGDDTVVLHNVASRQLRHIIGGRM